MLKYCGKTALVFSFDIEGTEKSRDRIRFDGSARFWLFYGLVYQDLEIGR